MLLFEGNTKELETTLRGGSSKFTDSATGLGKRVAEYRKRIRIAKGLPPDSKLVDLKLISVEKVKEFEDNRAQAQAREEGNRLSLPTRFPSIPESAGRRALDSENPADYQEETGWVRISVLKIGTGPQPVPNRSQLFWDRSQTGPKPVPTFLGTGPKPVGLQVSGRKADLVQRLEEHDALNQVGARGLGHDVAPVGTQWKEQKWGDSFAKAYLKKSLLDDKSKIRSMTPAEVYLSHPSFACYPKDRFIANLANLKEALRIERERVAEEEKEFLREQSLYPRGKVTSRGKPFWDTPPRESSHSTIT
ncbi:hypothetical protein THAOC_20379 [Thalassiosira oceanica]|uniref:SAP domain-containing protein n=1 Tax=Thalassiosira oceanica TaxID=159749 RepID=K0S2C8_THAOC|nr:hypothetical protein THAOC_20379 [Thalassiosira oceanica]|eukprot:EJK59405.1 hypothetical protein THAOC_20379 [Thalassiosira oceanica]